MANLIKVIHTGKKALGWDDETYRAVLYRIAGRTSSTLCTEAQLERVIAHMRESGFTPVSSKRHGRRPSVASSHKGLLSKVEALLADAGRPWSYAVSMAKHMFNRERVDWLTTDELTRLMQALVIDAKRRGKHENHRQP
ncbi:regulatory protein GemA [Serratia sp. JSRIV001]|uniref:gp16 family protein n=1 Tax=Serratia sp. JSRIV001 TaxID=2831893 RepID=UPI001CC17D15|nr:regulatory protein GemA [Serratia sp. JSRIV001]UAN47024.1 regulatory protein GemA [Serratia sp. JSRIV001]